MRWPATLISTSILIAGNLLFTQPAHSYSQSPPQTVAKSIDIAKLIAYNPTDLTATTTAASFNREVVALKKWQAANPPAPPPVVTYTAPVVTTPPPSSPAVTVASQYDPNLIAIFNEESGNNPTEWNSSGCLGLGQACPASKLLAICPTMDYNCEYQFFYNYAISRYGSTANALAFHIANGWW